MLNKTNLNPHFQVGIDLSGKRCLVIGGRAEACDKISRLLAAGAKPKVIAPNVDKRIKDWTIAGKIIHQPRRFQSRDMSGASLVINTVRSDIHHCSRVFKQARRKRIPINTFDLPQFSTLAMAALVAHGPLRISISTSNTSPALASRLRQDLEAILGTSPASELPLSDLSDDKTKTESNRPVNDSPTDLTLRSSKKDETSELEQFLEKLSAIRVLAKRKISYPADRRALLRSLTKDFRLVGTLRFPSKWRQRFTEIEDDLEKKQPS